MTSSVETDLIYPVWKRIESEGLNLTYGKILSNKFADELFKSLEESVVYFEGDLARVRLFGKWHNIPRQQMAYGDDGMTYKFSGNTIPAHSWPPNIKMIKDFVENVSGYKYNFVLVNRYKDGNDYMGEHKDDEKELQPNVPIASLSLGVEREFIFKHENKKKKNLEKKNIENVKLVLEHGSLLLMHYPTNKYWYHSLPKRKSCKDVRINLTFRSMNKL